MHRLKIKIFIYGFIICIAIVLIFYIKTNKKSLESQNRLSIISTSEQRWYKELIFDYRNKLVDNIVNRQGFDIKIDVLKLENSQNLLKIKFAVTALEDVSVVSYRSAKEGAPRHYSPEVPNAYIVNNTFYIVSDFVSEPSLNGFPIFCMRLTRGILYLFQKAKQQQ